jgi:hypothetical protein
VQQGLAMGFLDMPDDRRWSVGGEDGDHADRRGPLQDETCGKSEDERRGERARKKARQARDGGVFQCSRVLAARLHVPGLFASLWWLLPLPPCQIFCWQGEARGGKCRPHRQIPEFDVEGIITSRMKIRLGLSPAALLPALTLVPGALSSQIWQQWAGG